MIPDIEIWVLGWDKKAVVRQCQQAAQLIGDDKRVFWLCRHDHEAAVQNEALDRCRAKYWHMLHTDVQIPHTEYLRVMYEYMEEHPKVGLIRPNREGEAAQMHLSPYPKYWDGIAPLYRMEVGAWFDEEFIFTSYQDLDFGYEVEYRGYEVLVDPRVSVNHPRTAYASKPSFYFAYCARNHLLLDVKWQRVGRAGWKGVEWYNEQVWEAGRIPTMFELASYSQDELKLFTDSVESELYEFIGGWSRNLTWKNPVVEAKRG